MSVRVTALLALCLLSGCSQGDESTNDGSRARDSVIGRAIIEPKERAHAVAAVADERARSLNEAADQLGGE